MAANIRPLADYLCATGVPPVLNCRTSTHFSLATRQWHPAPSALAPRGLTLIELLVTIAILVTLLAGVLPAISPNNEARKIREAARQLTSLFAQAQAQAARDGRPVGVGFSDVWTDTDNDGLVDDGETTGMALEASIVAEPPAFTGFNSSASVVFEPPNNNVPPYPTLSGNEPPPPPLVNLLFAHGVGGEAVGDEERADLSDAIPPQTFRGGRMDSDDYDMDEPGDLIEVGNEVFEIVENDCDDFDDQDSEPDTEIINGVTYLKSQKVLTVRWLTHRNRVNFSQLPNPRAYALVPQGAKSYRIRRRPTTNLSPSRTGGQPLQFPRGIGIDLDPTEGNVSLAILFSPNGSVEAVYQDGEKMDRRVPTHILLGRVENANPLVGNSRRPGSGDYALQLDNVRYDFRDGLDDDELETRREEVNLLNADSRWVTVTPEGRVLTSENAIFDPRLSPFIDNLQGTDLEQNFQQRDRQREAAQRYATNLESETGG
jgi:prepilin-type N-terminal cleavage/methylation domain-containing protein